MARQFDELRARMSPAAQSRAAARAEAKLVVMRLQELRRSRKRTQVEMARSMKVEQAAVSKLERREDMYVSTLRGYVEALGGELKLVASFPDGDIQLRPSGKVREDTRELIRRSRSRSGFSPDDGLSIVQDEVRSVRSKA